MNTPDADVAGHQQPGLPLPLLAPRSAVHRSLHWSVSPIGANGRVGDRSSLTALGWPARASIRVTTRPGSVIIVRADDGPHQIDPSGHLRLHVVHRRAAHIAAGDRLLLIADLDRNQLLACTMRMLPAALPALIPPDDRAPT